MSNLSTLSKEKKLLINTIIFSIGNLGSKVISFIIVPIYTLYMNQQEYGLADIMLVTATLLLPVISFSLSEAVLRFLLTKEDEEEMVLFNSVIFISFSGIIFILLSIILNFIFNSIALVYLGFFVFFQMYYALFSQYSKGKERNILFSSMSIILSVFLLALNLVFLSSFDNKVDAFFLAQIISYAATSMMYFVVLKIYKKLKWRYYNSKVLFDLLRYSVPLIPNQIMWWIMNASSRIFIVNSSGYAISGLYAVSSKIPSIINIFTTIFLQSWQISAIEEINSKDSSSFFSKVANSMFSLLIICVSFILLILKPLMKVFVSDTFFDAWKYVPFLLLSLIFSSMSQLVGMSYLASMKTSGNFFTSVFGAVINLVLNFILVPSLGANGASIASAISFFVVFVIRIIDTRKIVTLHIDKVKWLLSAIVLSVQIYTQFYNYIVINTALFLCIALINRNIIFETLKKVIAKNNERRRP
ncbi:hypothetical protein IGK47_003250 [Enterococcus sp. AZ007]